MNRPKKEEYAEFYENYVSTVDENDIISALATQIAELQSDFSDISGDKSDFRYAEGKWSIRELLGHIIDGERVFSYRALRISRNDDTPLAGFEENIYVANSNFANTELTDLINEFALLRGSNVLLFKNLNAAAWHRSGTASDANVSVRALAYIMVGHVRHHLKILRERYLAQ